MKINLKSIKTQLILFLLGFALFLAFKGQDGQFLFSLCVTVLAAAAAECILTYLQSKKFALTESSIISGLIVGFVLASDNQWWVLVLASFLAILSKHLIRFQNRHIFNPAAFGIFCSTFLFQAPTQWKGTYYWYILMIFGFWFISKIRKMELLLAYGFTALGLFGIQALVQKAPILGIFGYMSYFYIFIMLIEPKTTPTKTPGKIVFGIGVALLIFVLLQIGVRFETELFALLVFNLLTLLLNRIGERRVR